MKLINRNVPPDSWILSTPEEALIYTEIPESLYLDVVLITKNEENKIIPTLETILYTIPINRIIIIDASKDRTLKALEYYLHDQNLIGKLKIISEPGKGCGYARQKGLENVETPYFAFVDAGALLPKDWFNSLYPHFNDENIAVVAGSTVFGKNCTPLRKFYLYKAKKQRFNPTLSNAILKTDLINKVGGFNPEYTTGEDLDLSIRIKKENLRWIIDPNVITFQHRSLTEHARQLSKWSKGTAIIKKNQNIGVWSIKHFLRSFKNGITDMRIHPTWLILDPLFRIKWLKGFYKHTKEIRKYD